MAVTAGQVVKRKGRDGKVKAVGVAAATTIYEGTLVYLGANGFAVGVKVDANTVFVGVARQTVDNSAGSNGDVSVECWTDGEFELPSSGLTQADLDAVIHGTDNYTTTKTATNNPQLGRLTEVVSASVGMVAIAGLGE